MKLEELVGEDICLLSSYLETEKGGKTKLLGVETGGIWIEGEHIDSLLNELVAHTGAISKNAIFVPYHKIDMIVRITDVALSPVVREGEKTH